jgi:hypothetical protein
MYGAEVGSANFYYSPLNTNPQMFRASPLNANPLILQVCQFAKR